MVSSDKYKNGIIAKLAMKVSSKLSLAQFTIVVLYSFDSFQPRSSFQVDIDFLDVGF